MERTYQPRPSRFRVDIPAEFVSEGKIVSGRCLNISVSGALAEFEEALEVWTTGQLRLHAGQRSCKLTARVARVQQREAGLAFHITEEEENTGTALFLQELIEAAQAQSGSFIPPF